MPILVDIDNTLAASDRGFLLSLNRRFGACYRRSQLTTYWIEEALALPPEQVSFLHELAADPEFYRDLQPLPNASAALRLLADADEIVYVSARPEITADVTIEWLDRHLFPVGALRVGVSDKVPAARAAGCQIAIEDSLENAQALATRLGLPVYLVDQPWNQSPGIPGITRVTGWEDTLGHLRGSGR